MFGAVADYTEGSGGQAAQGLRDALESGLVGGVLTEDMINDIGYHFLEKGLVDAAVDAFQFNAERFPGSWNVYDSLGEALAAAGRNAEAETSYRRALELNPWLSSSRSALEKMQRGQ